MQVLFAQSRITRVLWEGIQESWNVNAKVMILSCKPLFIRASFTYVTPLRQAYSFPKDIQKCLLASLLTDQSQRHSHPQKLMKILTRKQLWNKFHHIYCNKKMYYMHLNNPFHIEISRHFTHVDKYFLSLWAREKINCKIVPSHKWQWGWVVDLNKIMLNYILRNTYCKLNAFSFPFISLLVSVFPK